MKQKITLLIFMALASVFTFDQKSTKTILKTFI